MFSGLESKPERESFFRDFLSFELPLGTYMERVRTVVTENKRRLVVNMDDLRAFDGHVARAFLRDPNDFLPHWEKVLAEVVRDPARFPPGDKEAGAAVAPLLGFDGALGGNCVTPRGLTAALLRQLVMVEGIVTKGSLVKPKIVSTVQYDARSQLSFFKSYRDATSAFGVPTAPVFMSVAPGTTNPLSMEFGLCLYKDHQALTVQEMPEKAPPGQLPRSVEVMLDGDLADSAKPGDRVQVVGVYRALPSAHDGRSKVGGNILVPVFLFPNPLQGVFRSVLVANSIRLMGRDKQSGAQQLTPGDIDNILRVGAEEKVFERLAASLAPSIYGHDYVKRALLLQLLGGGEKNLANGTHIRGDINVMLIGDPSTAKSQLLRFVLNIAPLAVSTSGRGSSGVGLTAAVTSDPETHERRLEAGAMVLSDRGICLIDEFDKMSEDDRVAIHEVMEQGSCTINKAGIHTTLNARCSVLAAANPVYGQYNRQKKPSENIALPDSLLSRFDLMFIVLDNLVRGQLSFFWETSCRCIWEKLFSSHICALQGPGARPRHFVARAEDAHVSAGGRWRRCRGRGRGAAGRGGQLAHQRRGAAERRCARHARDASLCARSARRRRGLHRGLYQKVPHVRQGSHCAAAVRGGIDAHYLQVCGAAVQGGHQDSAGDSSHAGNHDSADHCPC